MASPDPVEAFLGELDAALDLPAADRVRVIREVGDHIQEDVARAISGGATRSVATQQALARIGPPAAIARQYRRPGSLAGFLAGLAAIASGFAALWLISVIALVLPARDPRGIPFWAGVAVALVAYVALTAFALRTGRRSPLVRVAVAVAGVAALGVGAFWIATELGSTQHFEGYILLLGLVLAGHGASLVLYESQRALPRRRPG